MGAGQQRQIEIRLERASTARSLWWLWTFGAIALAGAATAVAVTQSVPQSPIDGTLEPFRIRTVQVLPWSPTCGIASAASGTTFDGRAR